MSYEIIPVWIREIPDNLKMLKMQEICNEVPDHFKTAWNPSRYWDWCMSEDEEKRYRKIVGINIGFFVSCDRIQNFFFCP